ncbi:MAG: hypothetical protein H7061_04560 [Bdellovibrionaceae bacterium]|nr:hypothetical protein [Bdellovibrio sp.]
MKATLQKNKEPFQIRVPGKWILAGEHSVLRGGDAIVFPLMSRYLDLKYSPLDIEIDIQLRGHGNSDLELIIWSVFEKALKKLNLKHSQVTGLIELDSHILFGAGMGASATLCVALTELFSHLGYIAEQDRYSFATDLENLFHGESSGVDVAVTLYQKPLLFSRLSGFQPLERSSLPLLYLSHTGERGVTKDCVEKVKKLFHENRPLAEQIDLQMAEAVKKFKLLLVEPTQLTEWCQALTLAYNCFEAWGLVNAAVQIHSEKLIKAGALAVKLTGSGGGGFMLSLWKDAPQELGFEMIPCFQSSLSQK